MRTVKEIRDKPVVRKVLTGIFIFLFLFSIVGFFAMPPILKSVIVSKLSERLHREVTIQKISVNPFMLSVDIKGFKVKDRGNPRTLVSFDELYLNLQTASVWKRGLIVRELRLDRPYVNIIRNEDMTYNFSDLLEKGKPETETKAKPLRFSLNNIRITNGSFDFLDGPRHTAHKIRSVNLAIPFISDLPYYVNIYVQPSFEAVVNGTPVSFKGKTKIFADSRETMFAIDIRDFDIPYYLSYVPFRMNFRVPSALLDTQASVSYVQYSNKPPSINVAGRVSFKKVNITDGSGAPVIDLPFLDISIASTDLMSRKVNFSSIVVMSPDINVVVDKAGRMNLLTLIPQRSAEREKKPGVEKHNKQAPFPAVTCREIRLMDGKIAFSDYSHKNAFHTGLETVEVKIDHFSNLKDKKAAAEISFRTEADESVAYKSEFSVVPLSSSGTIELKGLKLKKYSPYYPENLLVDVEDGKLDLSTGYSFAMQKDDFTAKLSGLSSILSALRIKKKDEKEDVLSIPVVSVKDTDIDLSQKEVTIGGLATEKGVLHIKRRPDGTVNLQSLFANKQTAVDRPTKVQKKETGKPWEITLKSVALNQYTVKAEDSVPVQPVEMTAGQIKFRGENISTAKNAKGKVSLSFKPGKAGAISTNGNITVNPASADLKMNVKGFDIVPLQPYFTDKVKIIVTSGSISSKGALSVRYAEKTGPEVSYRGEASLSRFASVDKANANDFLKWNSLYLSGMTLGYNPLDVKIDEVALSDFYSRIIINKDGSLNVQGVMEHGGQGPARPEPAAKQTEVTAVAAAPPATATKKEPTRQIKIDKVTLQGGTINFSDRHIKPSYTANLLEIGGRISGLSSEENKFADVDLRGKLDNYAPLEITGKINPLRKDLYVDLKVSFKDMDLSPVSPYSGKYAGYTIQKGKLALNLQYLIVKKKLDSQNKVFLDQLTLGDKVESPDATKLPVRLAIALLKDRNGEIKLDIPVTGYINDPKFSMGRIVLKIIVNILAKAATSPFALLGAIFGGGGEELSYVDFAYGSTDIPQGEMTKIDKLVKALYDRPALKLEIEGHVDAERDRQALKEYIFNKKIKAQKLKEMVKNGLPPVPVDEVKIGKEEYPKFLKMAYKAEKFPKPRNFLGIAKSLPPPEMEKLMRTHIEVTDDDLRLLASQRALKVRDLILKSKQVEPERVFLVEPKTLSPQKKDKLKDSRVDFRLK